MHQTDVLLIHFATSILFTLDTILAFCSEILNIQPALMLPKCVYETGPFKMYS